MTSRDPGRLLYDAYVARRPAATGDRITAGDVARAVARDEAEETVLREAFESALREDRYDSWRAMGDAWLRIVPEEDILARERAPDGKP